MEAPTKVFWIEPTGRERRDLRCYASSDGHPCNGGGLGYHNAHVHLDDVPVLYVDQEKRIRGSYNPEHFADRPWPKYCSGCGTAFSEIPGVQRQIFTDEIYRAADGREWPLRQAPAGAMWHAAWAADWEEYVGADGIALCVRLPNGRDWYVDSQASNCTRPQRIPVDGKPGWTQFVRTHYCWCRHGDPRTGQLHVDKKGDTCNAGAGSIVAGDWHGFLHDGYLKRC